MATVCWGFTLLLGVKEIFNLLSSTFDRHHSLSWCYRYLPDAQPSHCSWTRCSTEGCHIPCKCILQSPLNLANLLYVRHLLIIRYSHEVLPLWTSPIFVSLHFYFMVAVMPNVSNYKTFRFLQHYVAVLGNGIASLVFIAVAISELAEFILWYYNHRSAFESH